MGTLRARKGFTLIELLVVIAIIAILAAILFPVFARARENARKNTCLSNLKQIGLALTMYQQDYDEVGPGYYIGGGGTTTPKAGCYWHNLLDPYVKGDNVWVCPTVPDRPPRSYLQAYGLNTYTTNGIQYSIGGGAYVMYPLSQFAVPAETIYALDGRGRPRRSTDAAGFTEFGAVYIYSWLANNSTGSYYFAPRHSGGANVVFCDGHAKWMHENVLALSRWWTRVED